MLSGGWDLSSWEDNRNKLWVGGITQERDSIIMWDGAKSFFNENENFWLYFFCGHETRRKSCFLTPIMIEQRWRCDVTEHGRSFKFMILMKGDVTSWILNTIYNLREVTMQPIESQCDQRNDEALHFYNFSSFPFKNWLLLKLKKKKPSMNMKSFVLRNSEIIRKLIDWRFHSIFLDWTKKEWVKITQKLRLKGEFE